MQIGFPKVVEIEAGKIHYTIVEVDRPKSIISIMFKTEEYDIQFGFYRARATESSFEVLNEGEEDEMIAHPTDKMEAVFPLQIMECNESMTKITFIAKESGFYKVIFSNEHSWYRSKTLSYRYTVLAPVEVLPQSDTAPAASDSEPVPKEESKTVEQVGLIFDDPERKLKVRIEEQGPPKIEDDVVA